MVLIGQEFQSMFWLSHSHMCRPAKEFEKHLFILITIYLPYKLYNDVQENVPRVNKKKKKVM